MLYELALAQYLASLFGSAFLRYSVTIGIFMLSMGLGSILYKPNDRRENDESQFIATELILCVLGLLLPILLLLSFSLLHGFEMQRTIVFVFAHLMILSIGFLSGYELPILANISERRSKKKKQHILSWDYLGMFGASVAFPFWIFSQGGVFVAFWISALLNITAVLCFIHAYKKKSRILTVSTYGFCAVLILVLYNAQELSKKIMEFYANSI